MIIMAPFRRPVDNAPLLFYGRILKIRTMALSILHMVFFVAIQAMAHAARTAGVGKGIFSE
jgi:hypothetical protein